MIAGSDSASQSVLNRVKYGTAELAVTLTYSPIA